MNLAKGIILAGGYGTRLYPTTMSISKHLLPIYDKPMIYYPIANLMHLNIFNILIIVKPEDLLNYKNLLGNGSRLGIKISYAIQKKAEGIPQALKIGKEFIGNKNICINLGDHILFGKNLFRDFDRISKNLINNVIFIKHTAHPKDYGILKYNKKTPFKIYEKPKKFISNNAVCGLYLYKNSVLKYYKDLKKSKRNEYEVTQLNNILISNEDIEIIKLSKNISWYDAGNIERIFQISKHIYNLSKKNIFVGYLDHIAYKKKLISKNDYLKSIKYYSNSEYSKNLKKLLNTNESY